MSDTFDARVQPTTLTDGYVAVDSDFAETLRTGHTRTFEVVTSGNESFTKDLPNVSHEELEKLDDRGLIRVGTRVSPGTLLVGKVEPRGAGSATPEEKLLRAIFNDIGDVRDVSLRTPPGCFAEVRETDLEEVDDGHRARVVIGWERPLDVGDLLRVNDEVVVVADIRSLDADLASNDGPDARVCKVATARDVVHARSIGPYHSFTQQPLEGRDANGGQRLTQEQAEVLATHAPWALWEMFTLKSDARKERTRAYEALVRGENVYAPPRPSPARQSASSGPDDGGLDIFQFFETEPKLEPGQVETAASETVRVLTAHLRGLGVEIDFEAERIEATPITADVIRDSSRGEVRRAATFDDENEPVVDGLHCPRLFGPLEDYRCACGKYARMKHRGVVCEECGVEVIQSRVRGERFGHIDLASPLRHPLLGDDVAPIETIAILPPAIRRGLDEKYQAVIAQNEELREIKAEGRPEEQVSRLKDDLRIVVQELFDTLGNEVDAIWDGLIFTKPVDYSGVAHLVVDPSLESGWCRLPQSVLVELFKPHTYGILEARGLVTTIKSGKRMVERGDPRALEACREASEGYDMLLVAGETFASRKVRAWDEPAIAVDPQTAELFDSHTVTLHLPLTDEAALECSQLPDAPRLRRSVSGWLSRAIQSASLVKEVQRAAQRGGVESAEDPLLRAALGRVPEAPDQAALEDWRESNRRRRETLRAESEKAVAEREPAQAKRPQWADRGIEELEISVSTYNGLTNAGLSTLGDLCRCTEAELLKIRHFGRENLKEIKVLLSDLELSLGRTDL